MKKKISAIILSLVLSTSLLTGCASRSSNSSTNVLDFSNTTLTGIVTSVDGSKITLSMGGGMGGNMMGGRMNGETPPDMPDETQKSDDTDTTENTDTNNDAANNANQNARSNANKTNTTFVLNISDESVIENASLSDITENAMLTITFGDNNTITKITIIDMSNMGKESLPDSSNGDTSSNTGTGVTTISEDTTVSDTAYASSSSDENALRVEGNFLYLFF